MSLGKKIILVFPQTLDQIIYLILKFNQFKMQI